MYPFTYEDSEIIDNWVHFFNCTFQQDFGVWKKDDEVDFLCLDIESLLLRECNQEGEIVKKQVCTLSTKS